MVRPLSGLFLGKNLFSRIVNLDSLTYAGNAKNLVEFENDERYRFVHGDICDRDLVSSIFQEESIDTVVHFCG